MAEPGRPTIYGEGMLSKAREYIASCQDTYEVITKPRVEKGIVTSEPEVKYKIKLPTIEGLAIHLGISRETVYAWEGEKPEFSDIVSELRAKQADKLIQGGISGDYDRTIAKVLLTKHGYREGIENTGREGKDLIPDPEAKAKADEVLASYLNGNKGNTQ